MKNLLRNGICFMVIGLAWALQGCGIANGGSPKSYCSEDGQVWMEDDTVHCALLGYMKVEGGTSVDTLTYYTPELELYPKQVHALNAEDGSRYYLFIYSRGHLLYLDEALFCVASSDGLKPYPLFTLDGRRDSVVCCMWYDQLVAASDGFPFDDLDENRFGIHYDTSSKRLYVPIMEGFEEGSVFKGCLRYTARYEVLQFNGKDFEYADEDGAWWLHPDLRNYQRTISNHQCDDGYEQIDLLPDSTYRRAFWRNAKTLDDLRKKPDEVVQLPANTFDERPQS